MRSADDLVAKAQRRLTGLKAALPSGVDWSALMVDVHDTRGRHVVYVDFNPGAGRDRDLDGVAVRAGDQRGDGANRAP